MKPFTEIVDLGRELYNGMPNLGASIAAFFPLETYGATRRLSEGRVGFEGRMILMAGTLWHSPRLSVPLRRSRAHS